MVLVTGMSFGLSHNADEPYAKYIWKRVKRLVFPVWIFLTIYFSAQYILYTESTELNLKTMLTSYALIGGIGYVWVIKVFLLVAIASPFLFRWHKNTVADSRYFLVLATCLFVYEFMRFISLPYIQGGAGKLASLIVHYIIPYAAVFAIGLRMLKMDRKRLFLLSIVNLGIFSIVGLALWLQSGYIVPTQALKYPPSIYYLSYALFASGLLWIYSENISYALEKMRIKTHVLFIASNSIWIYLWHIPFVKLVQANFALKYIIVFGSAVAIVHAQVWVVNNILLKNIHGDGKRRNIKTLLTG